MNYAPHTLFKLTPATSGQDEDGNIITTPEGEVLIGDCRCDDFDNKFLSGIQGEGVSYSYRIICDRNSITEGDIVRAKDGETVRGEGRVSKVKRTNYLNYQELWISK